MNKNVNSPGVKCKLNPMLPWLLLALGVVVTYYGFAFGNDPAASLPVSVNLAHKVGVLGQILICLAVAWLTTGKRSAAAKRGGGPLGS